MDTFRIYAWLIHISCLEPTLIYCWVFHTVICALFPMFCFPQTKPTRQRKPSLDGRLEGALLLLHREDCLKVTICHEDTTRLLKNYLKLEGVLGEDTPLNCWTSLIFVKHIAENQMDDTLLVYPSVNPICSLETMLSLLYIKQTLTQEKESVG